MLLTKRPINLQRLLGVSVHNKKELKQAYIIQADFALLSPVKKTITHPNAKAIGWEKSLKLIKKARLPVYLLGGMNKDDLKEAKKINAQGIAGITGI